METMKRTKVVDAFDASLYGTKVNVKGWVRTRRGNKNVNFIAVNDGSTIKNIQVVVDLSKFSEAEMKPITVLVLVSSVHWWSRKVKVSRPRYRPIA
jgi:asparaginyl-tRNA synthetase